jgi:hypothetical protein
MGYLVGLHGSLVLCRLKRRSGLIPYWRTSRFVIKRIPRDKPPGYEDDLSDYGPQITDGYCGKTIGWGFAIIRHLGDEGFNALGRAGSLECVQGEHLESHWYLITDWLTPEEAVQEYGPVKELVLGPLKGFRSVIYGEKKFVSKRLDPRGAGIAVDPQKIVLMPKQTRK